MPFIQFGKTDVGWEQALYIWFDHRQEVDEVLEAYPEGLYNVIGKEINGDWLWGVARLTHIIPDPVNITYPEDGAENINPDMDLIIEWEPVEGGVMYIVEVEREDPEPELSLEGNIEAPVTTFTISSDWLEPNSEYQVGVAAVNEDGNITWVEQTFVTSDE